MEQIIREVEINEVPRSFNYSKLFVDLLNFDLPILNLVQRMNTVNEVCRKTAIDKVNVTNNQDISSRLLQESRK